MKFWIKLERLDFRGRPVFHVGPEYGASLRDEFYFCVQVTFTINFDFNLQNLQNQASVSFRAFR